MRPSAVRPPPGRFARLRRAIRLAIPLATCLAGMGCTRPEPLFVSKADLDRAHTIGDVATICVGLKMKEDETREYAAQKLKDIDDPASACLCERLSRDGTWDPAVFNGLANANKDERVGCVAKLLDDPQLKDRPGAATAMLKVKAPAVHARLVAAANGDADLDVQAAALPVLRGTKDPKEVQMLIDGLKRGGVWGANAALNLAGNPVAKDALRGAVQTGDARTKAAALNAYRDTRAEDWPEVACAALDDADPSVRAAAVRAVDATRSPTILACMASHLKKAEPDSAVRMALLETLSKDAAPEAAKALCDAIPFWVRTYVSDVAPSEKSVEDIVYYQNDRDYENSLACAQTAFNAGGYSACGKAYLGARVNEFGGKVRYTACKPAGEAAGGGGGSGSAGVVEF
ncbi:MAG: hypothetical protein EXR69_01680 [Myxococcales bacterium]|nr:hypothetical protein [Myxococcales bacterium]